MCTAMGKQTHLQIPPSSLTQIVFNLVATLLCNLLSASPSPYAWTIWGVMGLCVCTFFSTAFPWSQNSTNSPKSKFCVNHGPYKIQECSHNLQYTTKRWKWRGYCWQCSNARRAVVISSVYRRREKIRFDIIQANTSGYALHSHRTASTQTYTLCCV